MRHLYMNGGGPAARVSGSHPARRIATLRTALAVLMLSTAVPLGAQQASRAKSPPPPRTPAVVPAAAVTPPPVNNESYNIAVPSELRDAPSSAAIGAVQKTVNVEVIARDRGWSRVRVEGWVPDSVLVPADTAFRANLSAADLRADPAGSRGKMVVWNVQFLAIQTADPLRHGLADEEPYILARGPNSENALLYLVVPPSLMGTARALQPLARITVTARVRDGRSDPVGIPILDIQTLRRIR